MRWVLVSAIERVPFSAGRDRSTAASFPARAASETRGRSACSADTIRREFAERWLLIGATDGPALRRCDR
jgi:hypothetical protein